MTKKKELAEKLLNDWNISHKILPTINCDDIVGIQQELHHIFTEITNSPSITQDTMLKRNRSETLFYNLDKERFSDRCNKDNTQPPLQFQLDTNKKALIRTDFPENPITYNNIEQYMKQFPNNHQLQKLGSKAIQNIQRENDQHYKPLFTTGKARTIAKKISENYKKTSDINQKIELVKQALILNNNFEEIRIPKKIEKEIFTESLEIAQDNNNDDYNPNNENWKITIVGYGSDFGQFHLGKDIKDLRKNDGRIHPYYDSEFSEWKPQDITPEFINENEDKIDELFNEVYYQTNTLHDFVTKREHTGLSP